VYSILSYFNILNISDRANVKLQKNHTAIIITALVASLGHSKAEKSLDLNHW